MAEATVPAQGTVAKEAAAPKVKTNSRFGIDKRTRVNRTAKGAIKTKVIKARQAIDGGDKGAAKVAVTASIKALDKAAKNKVIHPNAAARRKSRLVKRLNKAAVPAAAAGKAAPASTAKK